MQHISHGRPVWGKTIWICVASQTILIKSHRLRMEQIACGCRAADPSGSRSLMASTAGFTGANLFNKGLARMLQGFDFNTRLPIGPQNQDAFGGNMMETCSFSITTDWSSLNRADACAFILTGATPTRSVDLRQTSHGNLKSLSCAHVLD